MVPNEHHLRESNPHLHQPDPTGFVVKVLSLLAALGPSEGCRTMPSTVRKASASEAPVRGGQNRNPDTSKRDGLDDYRTGRSKVLLFCGFLFWYFQFEHLCPSWG